MYRGVCATCHSLNRIAFRNMDGVCYTTEEIKAMAAEVRCQNRMAMRGSNQSKGGPLFCRPARDPRFAP